MARQRTPDIAPASAFRDAVRSRSEDLRHVYRDDPIGLAEELGLMLPEKPVQIMERRGVYDPEKHGPIRPGLRDLIQDVCSGEVRSAAAVGPRGGGKSFGVSFIEFFLVFVRDYDALNLGGSELQADQVYQYLLGYIESDKYWIDRVKGDTLQSKTTTVIGAWIRVLTASQKSVRSPHAGGRKKDGRLAGGLLVIDEEAEADPEIVSAALPTINTALPSVNVRCSTFHNAVGSFADLIDDHVSMGYELYQWDIFDVCAGCDCVGPDCESDEKCFREDHYENFVDPMTGESGQRLIHRAYCGGRAKYADGWIPMEEVVTLWRRMKRNHNKWEVEAMGDRPSTSGYVIKDRISFSHNLTPKTGAELYMPGMAVTVCIDWGTIAAGLTVWQEQPGDRHVLLKASLIEDAGESAILGAVMGQVQTYSQEFAEVAADIGGGGNYLNKKLRDELLIPTRDVNFNEEKEAAVAAWNLFNEAELLVIPEEAIDFIEQIKKWRRTKQGMIKKGNDHLMDSSVCYFSKFIDRLSIKKFRVSPRTFQPVAVLQSGNGQTTSRAPRPRVPMIRAIGRGRNK